MRFPPHTGYSRNLNLATIIKAALIEFKPTYKFI
jgi:hypothetical protein